MAFLFLLFALMLIVFMRMFEKPGFVEWYSKYAEILLSVEEWIEYIGQSSWTILIYLILLLNFILKTVVPWFPLTFIMFLSGMVLDWYIAIPINLIGSTLLFTIKFYWGRKWGGGNAEKILQHFDKAHIFVVQGKVGSKMVLFFSRMTPLIPINSVSQLYGTTTMPFWQYILISIAGFSYKLFSYTMIGRNVFNPLSSSFLIPLIALLIISGLVLLLINALISATSPFFKRLSEKKGNISNEQQ